jgi:abortive infection bacteriophage resistance protein
LYYLDVDLRYLLIKYINRLELNFRTNLIYWTSMKYDENPIWYTDKILMSEEYLKDLKSHYNKNFINKNLKINHHHIKYPDHKYAPCWKTFEYYTFGSIVKIYGSLLDEELRKTIALRYNIKKSHILQNYLDTLVFVRNSCAHSGVIFDLHIDQGLSELPNVKFNNSYSHNLDAAIKALLYILEKISINRKNDLKQSIEDLFNNYSENEVIKQIVISKLGYIFPK